MTKAQIREAITSYINQNLELAEQYKTDLLLELQANLKRKQIDFGNYYDNVETIEDIKKQIEEVEQTSAIDLLANKSVESYLERISQIVSELKILKSYNSEDEYVRGLFVDTDFSYLHSQAEYGKECRYSQYRKKEKQKLYKQGLKKHDEYVQKGAEINERDKKRLKMRLKEMRDINEESMSVVRGECRWKTMEKNWSCRDLAELSVEHAFNYLGATQLSKHETEKIEQVIKLHDPDVVINVINSLNANPTENMQALAEYIRKNPKLANIASLEDIKGNTILLPIFSIGLGLVVAGTTILSIVGAGAVGSQAILSNLELHAIGGSILAPGVVIAAGTGGPAFTLRSRTKKKLAAKDDLISKCIDDLLDEVVRQETANKLGQEE